MEMLYCRNFYYYGNKLFQSDFIEIIQPGSSLIGQLQFNLLNSSVALVGYYAAAFTIDKPWMGRRRMQVNLNFLLLLNATPTSCMPTHLV
jgi:hypothetical protein